MPCALAIYHHSNVLKGYSLAERAYAMATIGSLALVEQNVAFIVETGAAQSSINCGV